ncbi:hypothetical protein U0035_14280 [Niabella yanshanensis]|uniref:HTH cro/C1-type domain-containing protein n=1 Tax=Niabella yanshanensis TaxID=577386 RepID=A0ABZ0W425_9BACT|nr:XRE family transcriptional regulator [Niabella yanshanensis]WQD36836.1 hypothetical protein U0035_14280 [Niabella yanshanensis]
MSQYRNSDLLTGIAVVAKQLREARSPAPSQEEVMTEIKIKTNISIGSLSLLCDYYNISLSEFMKKVELEVQRLKRKRK